MASITKAPSRKAWLQAKTAFLSIRMAHITEAASDTILSTDSAPSHIDPTVPLILVIGETINLTVKVFKLTLMKASTKAHSITAKSMALVNSRSLTVKSTRVPSSTACLMAKAPLSARERDHSSVVLSPKASKSKVS